MPVYWGIPVLRKSLLENSLNILGGTENESLHSAWGIPDLQSLRDLRTTAGNWNFLGDLQGKRISDDLYWGVQNLIDSCWRGKAEHPQLGGK